MAIIKFPEFSREADEFWIGIPIQYREKILANVFCSHCRKAVEIVEHSGSMENGDLLLR